jgi:alginate O-acetyltransferase complex protein AlgI
MNCRHQNVLLLAASYTFYGCWDWRFLSLIWISTLVDYTCAIQIEKASKADFKKLFLVISLTTNLTLLGFFKYFNFFMSSLQDLFIFFGFQLSPSTLNIILPVGISFYTFQTMSYSIDVYSGKTKPEKHFIDFALYVAFFPQLVAGPIERATRFLPQIQNQRFIKADDIQKGLSFIIWGYFLKVFVADNLSLVVDPIFSQSESLAKADVLIGCYAFAFQIYGDFAGYSAIAIGVARLMGFHLMTNFLFPYFVTNPRSFWQNWHISLSTWLRDYLYIPLGGNRKGELQTCRNLFITMLLGGLWHGASWNFILWGGFHGLILILHRQVFQNDAPSNNSGFIEALKIVFMFHVTCFGWLLFRASSLAQIADMMSVIFHGPMLTLNKTAYWASMTAFYAFFPLMANWIQKRLNSPNDILSLPAMPRYALTLTIVYLTVCLGNFGTQQFIYFQF